MKYAIVPFIALGLVLSLAIGIEYSCDGQEMFSTYFGSPFVFKQKSLGSSMEYFYSISGVMLNILTWSFVLYFIDKGVQRFKRQKTIRFGYKVLIGFMIAFTTFNLAMESAMIGHGFDKNSNYWYWNMDKEAKEWGMTCKGKLIILK